MMCDFIFVVVCVRVNVYNICGLLKVIALSYKAAYDSHFVTAMPFSWGSLRCAYEHRSVYCSPINRIRMSIINDAHLTLFRTFSPIRCSYSCMPCVRAGPSHSGRVQAQHRFAHLHFIHPITANRFAYVSAPTTLKSCCHFRRDYNKSHIVIRCACSKGVGRSTYCITMSNIFFSCLCCRCGRCDSGTCGMQVRRSVDPAHQKC